MKKTIVFIVLLTLIIPFILGVLDASNLNGTVSTFGSPSERYVIREAVVIYEGDDAFVYAYQTRTGMLYLGKGSTVALNDGSATIMYNLFAPFASATLTEIK